MGALESLAVILAIGYLVLAIRQSIWCWFCAFGSTAIYVYLFNHVALLMESALNVFYLLMAVYGFWSWRGGAASTGGLAVKRWPLNIHLLAISVIIGISVLSAALTRKYFEPAFPLLDSLTTWSAVWATFLVARKELNNWYYWFVIDALSVYLYLNRGLPLTAALFVLYLFMIPIGYRSWRADYRNQHVELAAGAGANSIA